MLVYGGAMEVSGAPPSDRSISWSGLWRLIAEHAVPVAFLALVVAIYLEPALGGEEDNPALRPLDGWWLLAGVVAANALTLRRSVPLASAAVVMVAVALVGAAPYDLAPVGWMVYVSAFALGRYSTPLRSLVGLALFAGAIGVTLLSDQGLTGAGVAFGLAFAVLAWFAGRELGSWRERVRVERSNADLRVASERQAMDLAITDERLRIAREVHDVVAHSMGLISVQAGMADAAFDARPDEARQALRNILAVSRRSSVEIRQIVGALREADRSGPGRSPLPSVSELDDLFAQTEAHGLIVVHGVEVPSDLPGSLSMSVYRIVQQALTNVIEHAGASRVQVAVRMKDHAVAIEVVDDGSATAGATAVASTARGFGIAGMRERARAFGGSLSAGPLADGGWRVGATIPVPSAHARERADTLDPPMERGSS